MDQRNFAVVAPSENTPAATAHIREFVMETAETDTVCGLYAHILRAQITSHHNNAPSNINTMVTGHFTADY